MVRFLDDLYGPLRIKPYSGIILLIVIDLVIFLVDNYLDVVSGLLGNKPRSRDNPMNRDISCSLLNRLVSKCSIWNPEG